MAGKYAKRTGKGPAVGRFVALSFWVIDGLAYRSLSVGARALLIELQRQFNGSNNGKIMLSHRLAAERLGLHRNSIGRLYRELLDRGFVRVAEGPCLGAEGVGRAALWILTMHPHGSAGPTNDFARWGQAKAPHKKQDGASQNQ